MRRVHSFFLIVSLFTLIVLASCSGNNKPLNPILPPSEEQTSRQMTVKPISDDFWNTSVMVDGEIWTAHMDELGRIVRSFGKGINPVEPLVFVDSHPELFGVGSSELIELRDETHGGMRVAIYRQIYNGIEIENTLVRVIYGKTGKLVSYGAETFAAYQPSGGWQIDSSNAVNIARDYDKSNLISTKKYYFAKDNKLVPSWRVDFDINSYLVSAVDGSILETHQNRYEYLHDGRIRGGVKPWSPLDNDITIDMYGVHVSFYTYDQYFLGDTYTDTTGRYAYDSSKRYRLRGLSLDNPWIKVQQAWDSGRTTFSMWKWVDSNTYYQEMLDDSNSWPAERNVLYYSTLCHDWFWKVEPGFNKMNFQLPSFVDKVGQCTAYAYTGGDPSIHFFQPYDNCTNTGLSPTIIAHEYGHIYVSKIYISPTGSLHEACADTLANRMFQHYMVGPDLYGADTFRRVSNNDRMWPATECDNEVHCVGNVLAGAFWNLSENIGHNLTDHIWHFSNYLNTTNFNAKAADVILVDDDDDDVTNGCPHYDEIYDAFYVHHNLAVPTITNPQTSGVVIDVVPTNLPHAIPFSTGGAFTYHLKIRNLDSVQRQLQVWASVEFTDGNFYGPILPPGYQLSNPITITLPADFAMDFDLTQNVPWHAPINKFFYHVRVGEFVDHHNDVIEDEGILEVRII